MFSYRGLGSLGVLLPALFCLALDQGLKLLGIDWHAATPDHRPSWWLFGIVLIVAGVVVFFLGRRVNRVSGPWLASYGRDKPVPRHTLNGYALEKLGPLSIVIGVGIVIYWLASL